MDEKGARSLAGVLESCINKLYVYRDMSDEPVECIRCGFVGEVNILHGYSVYEPGDQCPDCGAYMSEALKAMRHRVREELSLAIQNVLTDEE